MSVVIEMVVQYSSVLAWVTVVSIAGFVFGLLVVSRLVCCLPSNYFMVIDNPRKVPKLFRPRIQIARNITGGVLICLGLVMLVMPGQGLLTLFLGLVVMDFPGKKRVVRHLVHLKTIQKSLNWIRRKKGRPPFIFPVFKNR